MRYIVLAAIVGCAGIAACTSVKEVSGPDGHPAYVLDCGADRSNCLEKAGQICPQGYTVVDNSQGVFTTGNGRVFSDNTLTVSCKI